MLSLPKIGLGTWELSPSACKVSVLKALEIGYRLIDTAQLYKNEQAVGEAITETSVPREDYILATKLSMLNLSPAAVARTAEKSLQKLRTDYVDILYVHWPIITYNPKKTLPAIVKLVEAGKVR
ncbi:MAG TPA: aldo/keto reductase, partial [Candidatus Lokiarchaeia archaeon]|nr:aldo/keto reductase [Candidatus Lokiarchaeia archaeon]